MAEFTPEQIDSVGALLINAERPLKERFRALFTLKAVGGPRAIDWMGQAFSDQSALLKHEVAYCLGQLGDPLAVPLLTAVLEDAAREPIVRHEAAEALAAIGGAGLEAVLGRYCDDSAQEVAETCQLALAKLQWERQTGSGQPGNQYGSRDPAPPSTEGDTDKLARDLLDTNLSLFDRYRAMFALRNKGDAASVRALAAGLACSSALFRHEIAFVLGQVGAPGAENELLARLRDSEESAMVRHECAEALGGIAVEGVEAELGCYTDPHQPALVRESCVIALDMADYSNSAEFQYANALSG